MQPAYFNFSNIYFDEKNRSVFQVVVALVDGNRRAALDVAKRKKSKEEMAQLFKKLIEK